MKIAALRWPLACAALMFCAAASWGAPLTIEECLASAMKNNPDLLAAEEKLRRSAPLSGRRPLPDVRSFRREAHIRAGETDCLETTTAALIPAM